MPLVDLLLTGGVDRDALAEAIDQADAAEVGAALELAAHPDPHVRRAFMLELPLLGHGDPPTEAMVAVAIELSNDPDARVRDYACMALGTQWREVDTPELRAALTVRLDDIDREARCEALVGLAFRRDPSALPRVQAALSRPSGDLWHLEMLAAGALAEPGTHPLVMLHQEGWDDPEAATADAARRLTDPAGPGDDVIDGVANLYRGRAHGERDAERWLWAWTSMLSMLEMAPHRGQGFLWAVLAKLGGDPDALHEVRTQSVLAEYLEA